MNRKIFLIALLTLFASGIAFTNYAGENKDIILATTTSVQDTGLLDVLIEAFKKTTGKTIKAVAVGSGQAIQLGRTGEADILLVHSPKDEERFIEEGLGIKRVTFMHNDFVVLGPRLDPAGARSAKTAVDAFKKIASTDALFVSRGDNSGTYKKEKEIWGKAEVFPQKEAYIETGQGMSATIVIANEKLGYCLADRSTYLSLKKSIELIIVYAGDNSLLNYYSLIVVNPDKSPKVNIEGAKAFLNFMLSKDAQDLINNFGKDKFGRQIFFYELS